MLGSVWCDLKTLVLLADMSFVRVNHCSRLPKRSLKWFWGGGRETGGEREGGKLEKEEEEEAKKKEWIAGVGGSWELDWNSSKFKNCILPTLFPRIMSAHDLGPTRQVLKSPLMKERKKRQQKEISSSSSSERNQGLNSKSSAGLGPGAQRSWPQHWLQTGVKCEHRWLNRVNEATAQALIGRGEETDRQKKEK